MDERCPTELYDCRGVIVHVKRICDAKQRDENTRVSAGRK